jgi:predicted aspartyl protease
MRALMLAFCAGVSALLLMAPARAAEDCTLQRIASVDMGIDTNGRMTVPMMAGAEHLTMLVDTGGLITAISNSVADSQRWRISLVNARVEVYGGLTLSTFTIAHDIDLGGLKASSMSVLVMPDAALPDGVRGLLAPDILRGFDDDFDFANAKLNLYSPKHCDGQVVYWTKDPYAQIGIRIDRDGHMVIPVTLDGKKAKFGLDTGASISVMDWDTAKDLFGIDEHSPGVTEVKDEDGHHSVYKYAFKDLTFGNADTGAVSVANPVITLVPSNVSNMRHQNLIGIGIMRKLHLYVAYQEQNLYVTPAAAH